MQWYLKSGTVYSNITKLFFSRKSAKGGINLKKSISNAFLDVRANQQTQDICI